MYIYDVIGSTAGLTSVPWIDNFFGSITSPILKTLVWSFILEVGLLKNNLKMDMKGGDGLALGQSF